MKTKVLFIALWMTALSGFSQEQAPFYQPSPLSEWVAATLAYNFEEAGTENVVAGARIKINSVPQVESKYFQFLVIGNISKITSALQEETSKNLNEIIQSNQGLSVGLAPVYTFNPDNTKENYFRTFATINYKLNGFQNVGPERSTVNLSQGRFTLGLEFEGFAVTDGGLFNLSAEYIFTTFEKDDFQKVFEERVGNIHALELSLIVPLTGNFGIISSLNFSDQTKKVFQAGLIIKGSDAEF